MTEAFRITEAMEAEIEQEVRTLAPTDDTPREMFGLPRIRRRPNSSRDSEGTTSPQEDHRDIAPTEEVDATDPVNHPKHYTSHPSGIECITVTEWMSFNLGNCVKYIWRAGLKGYQLEDLKKARWYLEREIKRLEG